MTASMLQTQIIGHENRINGLEDDVAGLAQRVEPTLEGLKVSVQSVLDVMKEIRGDSAETNKKIESMMLRLVHVEGAIGTVKARAAKRSKLLITVVTAAFAAAIGAVIKAALSG
jgi:hypothetical protein